MKYTTVSTNNPSAVEPGFEGTVLNPGAEEQPAFTETPLCPTAPSVCAAEQNSRCPCQRECYRMFRDWYQQPGRYQRPDVTLSDRLRIAQRFYAPDRPWGTVSSLAQEYALSRQSIYDITQRVAVLFAPRKPGPVPKPRCPADLSGSPLSATAESRTPAEEKRLRNRLILTATFPGGVPLRPLAEILKTALVSECSETTMWRIINQAGGEAAQILEDVDYATIFLPTVMVAIDETYFNGQPILFVVEPLSLAICGFRVPADQDCSSATWVDCLQTLKGDQHLPIVKGGGDAAKPYPRTFRTVLEQEQGFQEDIFHQLRDLQHLRRKLENNAYRAFKAEWRLEQATAPVAPEQLAHARAVSRQHAILHDTYAEYCAWVSDAFQIVDLRSGEIRDREINEWLLDAAIAGMAQLAQPEVVKMSARLDNHKKYLLPYLDWLESRLAPLRATLHTYLDEPELEQVVLRAVARHWRLQHEVESQQRRAFRPALEQAAQELATWIAGDTFLEQWSAQLHLLLDWVQRASSAVENINSVFKPLVNRKKYFANPDTLRNFVALFTLWHNLRVFKEGKRAGHSPFELLGIDLGDKDWRTLLGYPPVT